MTPQNKIPTYQLTVTMEDETSGVDYVALVDKPAIDNIGFGSGLFMAFNSHENKFAFKATNEEKKIVSGPLMIPDAPIYRKADDGTEFNVQFSADSIYNCVKKFFKNQNTANVNEMHQATAKVDDVYMIESFIIDRSRMDAPKGFESLPDGSWFGSYKIDNPDVWKQIKEGVFKGFSVEGMFIPQMSKEVALMAQIEAILLA